MLGRLKPPTRLVVASAAALALGAPAVLAACAQRAESRATALERAPVTTTTSTSSTTSTTIAPTTTTAPVDIFALRPPAPGADPIALAAQIATAESTIRDPAASLEATAAAALAQQVAYRQLGVHPEWEPAVLAALPEGLRRTAELNAAARREFRAMHTSPAQEMPAWRIAPPAPSEELMAAYLAAEAEFAIPWSYLAAINLVETGMGRIRGTSTAGAQGPMQFIPSTWAAYGAGGDINDTHDAIMGAARYLAANNGAVDIDNALYRYNHSDRYVRGVKIYADLIAEHPRAFTGYYHWGVWYFTAHGDIYLPVGYEEMARIPVADYLAR
ncbi:MAG: transglycosylase SLT domain-containing protein [Actinomycetota bacterium]